MYGILDIISPKLAEELELRPLQDKEVVEFKLVRAGKVDKFSTKKTATPQAHILPGQEYINDPHDKKNPRKLIMNITGSNPIREPGKPIVYDPVFEYVRFGPSGSIYCTSADDPAQLYFLRLMNKNGTNPNRIKTKPIVFTEVDEKKEISLKNNIFDYRALAAQALLYKTDSQLLETAIQIQRKYPAQYNFDLAGDIAKIKASLAHIAEKQPIDFIKAVKEPFSYTRLLIDEAVSRKQIYFDDHVEKNAWMWKRDTISKGKKIITKLDFNASNPVKALVDFLQTAEGSEHRIELLQLNEENLR